MAGDWTREEVEATVTDYLEMLEAEVSGVAYNKAEHNRRLQPLLNDRTKAAIELKHQNVSAVLIELGLPYVDGYKPRRNYQQLLMEVVSDRVSETPSLVSEVAAAVVQPAALPSVDNILASLVEAPKAARENAKYLDRIRERLRPPRIVNYLEIESRNASLGSAGEAFVVRFEIARLERARAGRLAARVEQVSATRGDGLGYDVLSFEPSGRERLIEVKTTAYGRETPFFVSRNEVAVSRAEASSYHLYRLFDFRKSPRFYLKKGQLDNEFRLDPSTWEARAR